MEGSEDSCQVSPHPASYLHTLSRFLGTPVFETRAAGLPTEQQTFGQSLSQAFSTFSCHTHFHEDNPLTVTTTIMSESKRLSMSLEVLVYIKEIPLPLGPTEMLMNDRNILLHFIQGPTVLPRAGRVAL